MLTANYLAPKCNPPGTFRKIDDMDILNGAAANSGHGSGQPGSLPLQFAGIWEFAF